MFCNSYLFLFICITFKQFFNFLISISCLICFGSFIIQYNYIYCILFYNNQLEILQGINFVCWCILLSNLLKNQKHKNFEKFGLQYKHYYIMILVCQTFYRIIWCYLTGNFMRNNCCLVSFSQRRLPTQEKLEKLKSGKFNSNTGTTWSLFGTIWWEIL